MTHQSFGDQQIQGIRQSLIYIFRSKINATLSGKGAKSSELVAHLVWLALLIFLLLMLFIMTNVFIGACLADYLQSAFEGFGLVLVFYLLLITLCYLFREQIEHELRERLAQVVLRMKSELNAELDQQGKFGKEPKIKAQPKEDVELSSYEQLLREEKAYNKLARLRGELLKADLIFVKANARKVACSILGDRIERNAPMGATLSTLLNLVEPKQIHAPQKEKKPSLWSKILPKSKYDPEKSERRKQRINRIRPFVPYALLLWKVVKPTAEVFMLKKGQKVFYNTFKRLTKKKKR